VCGTSSGDRPLKRGFDSRSERTVRAKAACWFESVSLPPRVRKMGQRVRIAAVLAPLVSPSQLRRRGG